MILALNFLFVIPYFPYWKQLLNLPSKGGVSPSSCSQGGNLRRRLGFQISVEIYL